MIFNIITGRFLKNRSPKENTKIPNLPNLDANKIRELRNEVAKIESKHTTISHSI